ncbi:hypothetical protein [Crossiella cryophila]|uniref:Uncharacterized protein n=1 Tax=Crossiella cryophila TaxID=43355 RepID=A0A7W7CD94_9PSEU|nr:hypothetical protein [Crossiella cryophila]MBB4679045.1 hypothetical protein [Crossiella cryophila]
MTTPPRWLWRLMALPITLSMVVGVLMSISVGPASPFFLALALLSFLPLAGRSTTQLGVLCVLAGSVQLVIGTYPFMVLFTVSGWIMILVGLVAVCTQRPEVPGG